MDLGPQGPQGPGGQDGEDGKDGKDAVVVCKVKGNKKIKCIVKFEKGRNRDARLVRDGRTYASGTATEADGHPRPRAGQVRDGDRSRQQRRPHRSSRALRTGVQLRRPAETESKPRLQMGALLV